MKEIDKTKPVLVTGASGYIASWLVRFLLEDGWHVRATVRDPANEKKVGHLHALAQRANGRLALFQADLVEEGSFDEAMEGCELVFHTASPFVLSKITDPQQQLVDPALKGTRNVLESVNRHPEVKRVVLTSSVAAVHGDAADIKNAPSGVFTEADWNTTSSLSHQPYSYSKTVAERAAWEIAGAQQRWDLVVVNPGMVLGPSLTKASDSGSFELMGRFTNGSMRFGAPALSFGFVDVRDVAIAHIKAGLTPGASGRHILVSEALSFPQIGELLTRHFGREYPFPHSAAPKPVFWLLAPLFGATREFAAKNIGFKVRFDNSYARQDLGVSFRPIEETVLAHFEQMIGADMEKGSRARSASA